MKSGPKRRTGARRRKLVPGAPRLARRAVFLVGFMGSGKTSVGRALGQRLRWRFLDLDDCIEAREGRTIREIFRASGEQAFRRAETAALCELLRSSEKTPTVAALGGGAFVQRDNAELLERAAVATVFLDAPTEELWKRCAPTLRQRPLALLGESHFRQLYEARRPRYMTARLRVDTLGKEIDQVAAEVAACLGLKPRVAAHEES